MHDNGSQSAPIKKAKWIRTEGRNKWKKEMQKKKDITLFHGHFVRKFVNQIQWHDAKFGKSPIEKYTDSASKSSILTVIRMAIIAWLTCITPTRKNHKNI